MPTVGEPGCAGAVGFESVSTGDVTTSQVGMKSFRVEAGTDYCDAMQKLAERGDFEMFDFNGRTIMYSHALPAKTGWLLNMNRTKVRIHRGTNFTFESWQMLPSKVAKKRDCLTYAAVYTKRRNANGVITFT